MGKEENEATNNSTVIARSVMNFFEMYFKFLKMYSLEYLHEQVIHYILIITSTPIWKVATRKYDNCV